MEPCKMTYKVATVLAIITSVRGSERSPHEPHFAISTQSFHRDDVPLSYKYTAVHDYTTTKPEQNSHRQHALNPVKYHSLQYAPLDVKSEELQRPNNERYLYQAATASTEGTFRKDHLEPRLTAQNLDVHNQNYRSFVPGHNVEVLNSNRNEMYDNAHKIHQESLINQRINQPTLVLYRKPEQTNLNSQIQNFELAQPYVHRNLIYAFHPKDSFVTNPDSLLHNHRFTKHPRILAQNQNPKLPRLHLNLARVFGVAHMHEEEQEPNLSRPPTLTQAYFLKPASPHKTLMYPVQRQHSN